MTKQILISRCRILALPATTLENVQTSEATAKGLRLIAEELDEMAVDISRLEVVIYEQGVIEGKPLLETMQKMITEVENATAQLQPFLV
jgi:hypothetical protein